MELIIILGAVDQDWADLADCYMLDDCKQNFTV